MMKKKDTKAKDNKLISDYKNQANALSKSHCVIEFELDGTIIDANANFLSLMGYTLKEIQGKNHGIFFESSFASSTEYQQLWKKISHGELNADECKQLDKKGKEIWLQIFYSLIEDEEGNSVRIIALSRNITETKINQLAEVAEHKVLIDMLNMTSIISHSDLTGRITDINEKYIEVSQYSREELIGSPHSITRHPDMPKALFKQVWNTIGHGKIFRGVIKNRKKDGEPYYVDAVIAPIMGNKGKPRKYIGVRYEITELEIERQNIRGILAAIDASNAYIEFDTNGNVLMANKNFLQLLGYQAEEIVGKHHRIFVEPEMANSQDYIQFWKDLNAGKNKSDVFKRMTKSGGEVWIQAVYTPVLDEMGRVIKILKIATDITTQTLKNIDYQNRVKGYSAFIRDVADGDLRQRVDTNGDNELSLIGNNLNTMVEGLTGITNQIDEASSTLLGTFSQIHAAVNTQASAASQQAAAVSEITSTLEEVRATSAQNLDKAKQLGKVAEKARFEGDHGQKVLSQTISSMEVIRGQVENIAQTILALSEQTQQIREITEVVSSIAQQSKMLALNASIEAAKAGEAGKGFAVVAAEVKELAIQSQQSTVQVQKILQDIQRAADCAVMATEEGNKRVDDGVSLVEKSGEMMTQLSEVINETVHASKQIVAAVQQEVVGIDQVAISMSEINKVTSQFVNNTQETKEAATNMGKVAEQLKESISIYKT